MGIRRPVFCILLGLLFLYEIPLSDVHFVHHSWEWDALADVFLSGEPCDSSFDAEAEAAVGDGAVFSQIQVPVVIFNFQALSVDSRNKQVVVVLSHRAADDFTEAGGGE